MAQWSKFGEGVCRVYESCNSLEEKSQKRESSSGRSKMGRLYKWNRFPSVSQGEDGPFSSLRISLFLVVITMIQCYYFTFTGLLVFHDAVIFTTLLEANSSSVK